MEQYPHRKSQPRLLLRSYEPCSRSHRTFIVIQLLRKTTAVKSVFTSLGKTVLGISGGIVGGYIGWYGVLKSQEGSEIYRVVLKNECGTTPLWKSEDSVVNLREKDYKTFMSRRQGR